MRPGTTFRPVPPLNLTPDSMKQQRMLLFDPTRTKITIRLTLAMRHVSPVLRRNSDANRTLIASRVPALGIVSDFERTPVGEYINEYACRI